MSHLVFRCVTAAPSFLFEEVRFGLVEATRDFLASLTQRRELLQSLSTGDCPKFMAWPCREAVFLSQAAEVGPSARWLLERVGESSFEVVETLPDGLPDLVDMARSGEAQAGLPRVEDVSLLLWANGNMNWAGRLKNASVCFRSHPISSAFVLKACENQQGPKSQA